MDPPKGMAMDWMYKPAALVNRDEYLLGRSVDKSFDLLESVEKTGTFNYADEVEKDLTPLSIFAPTRSGPVDVIQKIKEDPLYQIQKKEEENLKQLLKNPVRMKLMRQISTELQERQRRLSESSSSTSKRRRRHSKRDSSSDSDSDDDDPKRLNLKKVKSFQDIDKLISEKLKSLKKHASDVESDSSEEDSSKKHVTKKHHHHHHDKDKHDYRPDRDSDRRDRYRDEPRHYRPEKRRSRSRSRDRNRDRYNGDRGKRSRSRSGSRDRHVKDRDRKPTEKPSSSRTNFTSYRKPAPPVQKRAPLDEAELEKRRQEMMSNAKWRDEQRTKNVTKYREEEKKEEEQRTSKHDPDFIRKQLIEAANTGSVEKRIKSNSYNIQKSYSAMNQNFAKR